MEEVVKDDPFKFWLKIAIDSFFLLLKRWYLLVLAVAIGAGYSYYKIRRIRPIYTATYTFVLSTDQAGRGNGLAGLASQLGFDGLTSSPDNIFAGDNIIGLFKSRMLIASALLSVTDTTTHQSLLNYIAQKDFPARYKKLGVFGKDPSTFSKAQTGFYRMIIGKVSHSFLVFKKDKKLIFYCISGTDTDPGVAYHIAKTILDETAQYFIDTKVKVAASSVSLLQHESDSLARVLDGSYRANASMTDRTYNLNPALTIQRSPVLFNQAKANAIASAYVEVMRNLEIAKINLQKETPLYRIIDQPELPLFASAPSKLRSIVVNSMAMLFLAIALIIGLRYYKNILSRFK